MLKDFYTTLHSQQIDTTRYEIDILLNENHEIFKGHFPNFPITPGVCMLQIIKNFSEEIIGEKLFMSKTSNVKFMALINPKENAKLKLSLEIIPNENGTWVVKNTTSFGDTIALKLTNTYQALC
ncbi:MAG: 3-hydroxyacyl-ACP dehydratase [Capnocytophaga sp.]|nr:3-hydroxyacyl-ACP dehydratase [Capnocytophaga sp.]